jgi:lysozyme
MRRYRPCTRGRVTNDHSEPQQLVLQEQGARLRRNDHASPSSSSEDQQLVLPGRHRLLRRAFLCVGLVLAAALMATFKNVGYAFVVCAGLCATFEGLQTSAYHDTLAHGLPTVCYGETEGVKMGDHYTAQECKDMLAGKLPRYWAEISKCIKVPISENEQAAYTATAYNIGSGGFCHSGMVRHLNAGDHKGACNALMAWNRAGGREVRGLTRRRAAERSLCLTGL